MQTIVHRTLLSIFANHNAPLSAADLLASLKKKKLVVNKTTVYRQLAAMQERGVIREVIFGDRTARYELNEQGSHHHHLVCLKCHTVSDVDFPDDLSRQERTIWKKKKFKVLHHSLEFFGWCNECKD